MEAHPLVSIITVCYNSEKTISNTIESVLSQTYSNIEYIIVDGKSSDSTVNIIKQYDFNVQGKIKWISEQDKGLYDAMNKGINLSRGDIIGILNSDDIYIDKFVVEKVTSKIVDEKVECLYADVLFVDKNNTDKIVRKWIPGKGKFKYGWNPPHPSTFIKKSIYDKYGLYKTDYEISSDYDALYRFINKNEITVTYLNEFIVKMRMGGKSTSGIRSTIQGSKEIYITLRENDEKFSGFIVLIRLLRKIKQLIL